MNRDRCFNPAVKYKPQFARAAGPGQRFESHMVPFSFQSVPATGQLVRGLPLQLDDDQPFWLLGIFIPSIGTWAGNGGGGSGLPEGLCRVWDSRGNPLSQGLVLGFGMFGNAGRTTSLRNDYYGWGFPVEDPVLCDPGGTLLFDFQLFTNATIGGTGFAGVLESIEFFNGKYGTAGNGYSIELIDPGAPNVALSVAIVGMAVEVTLATDGASAITTTFLDVYNLFLTSPELEGVMVCTISGLDPNEVITTFGPDNLSDGAASTPVDLFGTLIGEKVFEDC